MNGHRCTLVASTFEPQAMISLEWRNCSGSVPYRKPSVAIKPAPPAAEQMVRSSRDAPSRWKKRRSMPPPFKQSHGARVAIGQNRFGAEFGRKPLRNRPAMVSSASSQEIRSKFALAFPAGALLRVEQPVRRVLAI